MSKTAVLFIKTGALGDVLRTTSLLPGLKRRFPDLHVTWVTANSAADLVRNHSLVDEVLTVKPKDEEACAALGKELAERHFDWCLSLDDEHPLCRMAFDLKAKKLSGAFIDTDKFADGSADVEPRAYSDDTSAWFDMGLLSRFGKERADQMKKDNERSHPDIFAEMFGVEAGRPELPLSTASREAAEQFAANHRLHERGALIGLNTGAGGRWRSKMLPVDRTLRLVRSLHAELDGKVTFLLLGGPDERERNDLILAKQRDLGVVVDAGTDNSLLDFAGLVDRCDLLVTSDSLALHIGAARSVPMVAFFAPTSAAEIELYGRGEKIVSTAPDYCSYKPEADTSSITVERLHSAVLRQLKMAGVGQ